MNLLLLPPHATPFFLSFFMCIPRSSPEHWFGVYCSLASWFLSFFLIEILRGGKCFLKQFRCVEWFSLRSFKNIVCVHSKICWIPYFIVSLVHMEMISPSFNFVVCIHHFCFLFVCNNRRECNYDCNSKRIFVVPVNTSRSSNRKTDVCVCAYYYLTTGNISVNEV